MNSRVQTFLQCFDSKIQTEIINFCNRISNIEADVFILMARKAACFFNCLEELGIIRFNGYVTSERILDMDCEWMRGKSIVIIDDSIVSGTTLHMTIQALKNFDVASIDVHVMTINDQWYKAELLKQDNGNSYVYQEYNRLPDNECIKLCNDIVCSISSTPRPYDIDFPYYKEIIVPKDILHKLINNIGWERYDISNDEQNESGISSITLIPTEYVLEDFCTKLGLNSKLFCLYKIRLYCRQSVKNKGRFHIRIVPMLIFDELSLDTVSSLFDVLIKGATDTDISMNDKAKLRLIQFFCSDKLAKLWYSDICDYLPTQKSLFFEDRNLTFLFPRRLVYIVKQICNSSYVFPKIEYKNFVTTLVDKSIESENSNHVVVDNILISPFLEMYNQKELPCRKIVFEQGIKAFENPEYQEYVNRLNTGISAKQLEQLLTNLSKLYHIPTRVSLFIDKSVDAGIIVPITEIRNQMIYRSYRHGEDVLFSVREETMYLSMLEHFQKYSGRADGLPHILTEKLIVLFTEIGLREKFLKPYISRNFTSPKDKVLRIKTHLHGKVALIDSGDESIATKYFPYITMERKGHWFTAMFSQNRKLRINTEKGDYYQVPPVDIQALTDEDIGRICIFSQLMADVCNPNVNTGPTYSNKDLVIVTSSANLKSVVRSIAAEVNIFQTGYVFEKYPSNNNIAEDYKNIRRFRHNNERLSIHSAFMKMNAYISGEGKRLVDEVKFDRVTDTNQWRIYFKEELSEDISSHNRYLLQIFNQQRLWIYTTLLINTCLYVVMLSNYQLSYESSLQKDKKCIISPRDFDETKSQLQTQKDELVAALASKTISDTLAERVLSIVSQTIKMVEDNLLVSNDHIQQLDEMNEDIRSSTSGMQDDVCCALGSDGKVRNVICYNNVLCVQFYMPDRERLDHVKRKIKYCLTNKESQIEKRAKDTSSASIYPPLIAFISENESPSGFEKSSALHEVWLRATSESGADLAALALNIYYELAKIYVPVHLVLLANMRYADSIKSDDLDFTKYYCNNFSSAIQHLSSYIYPQQINVSEVVILTEESAVNDSKALQFLKTSASHLYECTGCEEIKDKYTDRVYLKQKYQLKKEFLIDGGIVMHKDIGIITVLPEESTAVRTVYQLEEKQFNMDDRLYYHGTIQGDQTIHSTVMTQAFSQGPASIISAYISLMEKFTPAVIFIIGIAGGIDDDINLCDVVVPREVFCYDMAKDTPNGIIRRSTSYQIEAKLIPTIQRLQQTIREKRIGGRDFKVAFDPIGSGSVVIAHKLSEITTHLKNINSKVTAVEMEASGICSAVYEDGVNCKQPIYGVINFRGISDHADEDKPHTQSARTPAAENAALVSKEFVHLLPKLKARE